MKGQCLCRKVTVEVDKAPEYINICNCRFCRSFGAAWGYYDKDKVTITGETRSYRRDDLDEVFLDGFFCSTCGSCTHYDNFGQPERNRMAVNTRLFAQDELDRIEVRYLDIRGDDMIRTGEGHIGDGKAF
jgi:hypothetical protein